MLVSRCGIGRRGGLGRVVKRVTLVARMLKDVTLTFRMPQAVRDGLEIVAKTDLRPAGQYLLQLLVADLVKKGVLLRSQGALALIRAPRSDRKRRGEPSRAATRGAVPHAGRGRRGSKGPAKDGR